MTAFRDLTQHARVVEMEGPVAADLRAALEPLPEATARFAPPRVDSFVRGRAAAKLALRAIGADVPGALAIDSHGAPLWPHGVVGSITHDGSLAAAAVAPSTELRGVGLDLQRVTREPDDTVALVASREEIAHLDACPEDARFTVVFAAKESLYKCLAPTVGAFFGFEDALVVSADASRVSLRLERALHEELPRGLVFDVRYRVDPPWVRAMLEWRTRA